MGTYIHGLFDMPGITWKWLKTIGHSHIHVDRTCGLAAREREYEELSRHFQKHIHTERILDLL